MTRPLCLANHVTLDAPSLAALTLRLRPLPSCDCRACKAAGKSDTWSFAGCDCPDCVVAGVEAQRFWLRRTTLNRCDCCGKTWTAHTRANLCPACWDTDRCRVCFERPGLVCDPCTTWAGMGWEAA